MNIFGNGTKYQELQYSLEEDFENDIAFNHKIFFGQKTIYIDAKKKIESKSLGGTIPDGFFFDISDFNDPQFYLVEVELSKHSFFNHIFPQITKFFAFFNNHKTQKSLVDKLFSIINTDEKLKKEFRKNIGNHEIYKFISDVIENSQNILLILDNDMVQLPEIMETYSDTWGRMVKYLIIKKYINQDNVIYTLHPDYEILEYFLDNTDSENSENENKYSEEFHLEKVNDEVKAIYYQLRNNILEIDSKLIFNPQKYYVSVKSSRNIVYFKFRKKKLRVIIMLEESEIKKYIKKYTIQTLSSSVQNFYNGSCAAVDVDHANNLEEIIKCINLLINVDKI